MLILCGEGCWCVGSVAGGSFGCGCCTFRFGGGHLLSLWLRDWFLGCSFCNVSWKEGTSLIGLGFGANSIAKAAAMVHGGICVRER